MRKRRKEDDLNIWGRLLPIPHCVTGARALKMKGAIPVGAAYSAGREREKVPFNAHSFRMLAGPRKWDCAWKDHTKFDT